MKSSSPYILSVLTLAFAAVALHSTAKAQYGKAQYGHPQSSGVMHAGGPAAGMPPLPASPLAGGMPAAQAGGAYMDVHGRPVVMPASYCQGCSGGPGYPGGCGAGPGGYGDPMAVDFGGYASEQCGPHYWDVQFGLVYLYTDRAFEDTLPFTSVGVAGADRYLDAANDFDDYEPGWEVALRYDIGPLSVIEASYMGVYDIGYSDSVSSEDVAPGGQNFQLFSVFSDYGTGTLTPGIDDGQVHAIRYEADLQSTEINFRRYWAAHNPCITGTWMLGARYFRYTDNFAFASEGLVLPASVETANLNWDGENDLVGFHFGGDGWMCVRQGLRLGMAGSAGVYNNRFKYRNSGAFSDDDAPDDYSNFSDGNQVAFAAELESSVVADILPSWSLRFDYRVMYLNDLVTAENNINQQAFNSPLVNTEGSLLFHGFQFGTEYIW